MSNFKYNVLLKEFAGQGLVSQELDDYSKTFLTRFNKEKMTRTSKIDSAINLQLAHENKTMELKFGINVNRNLLQPHLKQIQEMSKVLDDIAKAEEKTDSFIAKFEEVIQNFEGKIHSFEDQFSPEKLKDELLELTNAIEGQKAVEFALIQRLEIITKRLEEMTEGIPQFDNLKVVKNKLLVNNVGLQEKEKQFKVLKQAQKQMEARLKNI